LDMKGRIEKGEAKAISLLSCVVKTTTFLSL
jgi:hypothetical protein